MLHEHSGETALYPQKERFTTDERGEFRFEGTVGTAVEAWHPVHGSARAELTDETPADGRLVLRLSGMVAKTRAPFTGRVLLPDGSGAGQALVWVGSANSVWPKQHGDPLGYTVLTNDDGAFTVAELEPGLYDVSAHLSGLAPARAGSPSRCS